MTKMENSPLRFSPIGYLENMSDMKSRFLQVGSPSVSRAEVICPKPRRATGVPYVLDSLNRYGSKSKGLPALTGYHGLEILNVILNKDELESDSEASNQIGFLCGSPPVRTSNPVVQDVEFAKLSTLPASSLGNSHGMKLPRHDKGSPSCGSLLGSSHGMNLTRHDKGSPSHGSLLGASPKVRIEGFTCGSPDSHRVVSALA